MNQRSEERAPERMEPQRKAGSVLPFEKPQSPQQRHIRERVQERLDRERVSVKRKISPVRLIVTLAVAVIPVVLTFGASDAVLRRIQLLTRLYAPAPAEQAAAPAQPAEPDRPGIVMMMPDPALVEPAPPAASPATPAAPTPGQRATQPSGTTP